MHIHYLPNEANRVAGAPRSGSRLGRRQAQDHAYENHSDRTSHTDASPLA